MIKNNFGNYPNTSIWFKEFKQTVTKSDYLTNLKLGLKFPIVVVQDFYNLTKKQKIVTLITLSVFLGIIFSLNLKLEEMNEKNILKCDCSLTRENDSSYGLWYTIGYDYGHKIPKLFVVESSIDSGEKLEKSQFSLSWIKNWININGSKQMGGYPNMEKYRECWEKGFIVGRNDYFDDNDGSNRIPK